jgi:photosystem II stability/assembly factor-like uncharacterized protein
LPSLVVAVFSFAFTRTGEAYAIGWEAGGFYGVYRLIRSNDSGETWSIVNAAPGGPQVIVDAESGAIYLAGSGSIFVSRDEGKTWTQLFPAAVVNKLVADGPGHFYAATNRGVLEYNAGSQAWTAVGSVRNYVRTVTITSSTPRRIYAAENFAVITKQEGDRDWVRTKGAGLVGASATDVAVARSKPSKAYATTLPGIFRTDDEGQSWQLKSTSIGSHVEISPEAPNTAYVSSGSSNALLKTTDGGATWTGVTPTFPSAFAVAPSDSATLYAALASGMSKTTDGGRTWVTVGSGIASEYYDFYYGFSATSITIDPSNASNVYLGRNSGLYKTTDGGSNWQKTADLSAVRTMAIDPADSSIVYAARYVNGVLKSDDGGVTWNRAGLIDKVVVTLAISGTDLYAGTGEGHIYKSSDGGEHWKNFDDGLARGFVSRVAVDASGHYLYAATSAGLYQYRVVEENIRVARSPDDMARLPGLLERTTEKNGFVIPVSGTVTGVGGARFSTEVTLTNEADSNEDVLLFWLPQDSTDAAAFRLTLPPSSHRFDFGLSGIGSLVVMAVDDSNASISGSARIAMDPNDGRAPRSQSIPEARRAVFAEHVRGSADGMRHDEEFRTNVGVVNLSSDWRQVTMQINGDRASGQFTVAVPPFSLVQTPLPESNYGTLSIVAFADTATKWLFYASTIERSTGEAQTTLGGPN